MHSVNIEKLEKNEKSIFKDDKFYFIGRILRASSQKFFKKNQTFVLRNKAVMDNDCHLKKFHRFIIREISEIRVQLILSVCIRKISGQ